MPNGSEKNYFTSIWRKIKRRNINVVVVYFQNLPNMV